MAVTFAKQKKKQKYLILAFAAIMIVTLVVLWQGFLSKMIIPAPISSPQVVPPREIEINEEILKSEFLKNAQAFEEVPLLEGEGGRENPFLPY